MGLSLTSRVVTLLVNSVAVGVGAKSFLGSHWGMTGSVCSR